MPMLDLFSSKRTKSSGVCTTCGCNDFSTEFAGENPDVGSYMSNGVKADSQGDRLRLSYSGLLVRNGAQDVYAVVGYGDSRNWNDVKYYRMDSTGRQTFEVSLPIHENIGLNVAFKDGANNWDNNAGRNYSFGSH